MRESNAGAEMKQCRCCPTCGRPIPPKDFGLSPSRQRILDIVSREGPVETLVLVERTGVSGVESLRVIVSQINKKLAAHGMRICGSSNGRRGYGSGYRLIKEAAE